MQKALGINVPRALNVLILCTVSSSHYLFYLLASYIRYDNITL